MPIKEGDRLPDVTLQELPVEYSAGCPTGPENRSVGELAKGKRIAIVEGYSYGEAVDNAGPVFVRSRSEEDSLKRLLASEVDYSLMDDLVVQYIVSNYATEARTRLQVGTTPLVWTLQGFGPKTPAR